MIINYSKPGHKHVCYGAGFSDKLLLLQYYYYFSNYPFAGFVVVTVQCAIFFFRMPGGDVRNCNKGSLHSFPLHFLCISMRSNMNLPFNNFQNPIKAVFVQFSLRMTLFPLRTSTSLTKEFLPSLLSRHRP